MTAKKDRKTLVAFRLDEDLVTILDRLPNKSAFIRRAIISQLGVECPLCRGRGLVSRGAHAFFGAAIDERRRQFCVLCLSEVHLPSDTDDLAMEDRLRLEQFYHGGPLYCDDCYRTAEPCGECDWRLDMERRVDHRCRAQFQQA